MVADEAEVVAGEKAVEKDEREMPFCEYECRKGGHRFERLVSIFESDQKQPCPNCNSEDMENQAQFLPPSPLLRPSGLQAVDSPEAPVVADRGCG